MDLELQWFAARLSLAVYDTNREFPMSVEVKGLADTVRAAKAAISGASDSAARLQASASRLTGTLAQVDGMTAQLDAANADLQGAVGLLSNGGPPLDDTSRSSPRVVFAEGTPAPSVQAAIARVDAANGNI